MIDEHKYHRGFPATCVKMGALSSPSKATVWSMIWSLPTMPLFICLPQGVSEQHEKRENRDEELNSLAALTYHGRLTHFIRGSTRSVVIGKKVLIAVVDFRLLFAVVVYHFQKQLAEEIRLVLSQTITYDQLDQEVQ